ncbi:hypothetical protein GCM10028805_25940 [Spirosoma harenae]
MSYADEVYQQWKEENQNTTSFPRSVSASQNFPKPFLSKPSNNLVAEAPVCSIPDEVFRKSLGQYDNNQFAKLLRQHFGDAVTDELLSRFQIGTSKCWDNTGASVFWLIDEKGHKRGGQIKLFDSTFHTVKYVDREGRTRTRTSWVHSVLAYSLDQQQLSRPDWLTDYIEQKEFAPCLFGLPQLLTAPADKPIAIVEAPKTAVIATPYFPQFTWMAVIGRSYLNAERLAPLKGRSVILFPDLSINGRDYAYWKGKADGLRQQGFNVIISDWLEKLATDEERKKGFDLADYLLEQWKGYPPIWDQRNPPDAIPTIEQQTFFEWYQNQPPFISWD